MGRSGKSGLFGGLGRLFTRRKANAYLEQHNYYDSFDDKKCVRNPGSFPYLPYSFQDLLESKPLSGKNILVASHRSTALWLRRGGKNTVTLARPRHDGKIGESSRLQYLESYRNYSGAPLDLLIWDSHRVPGDWEEFTARVLAPNAVAVLVSSEDFSEPGNELVTLIDTFTKRGMRLLEFRNPGPRREVMTAVLCYPRDNVLDI